MSFFFPFSFSFRRAVLLRQEFKTCVSNQLLLSNLNRNRIKTQKHKKLQFPRSALVISCFVVDKMVVVVGIEKGGGINISLVVFASSLQGNRQSEEEEEEREIR